MRALDGPITKVSINPDDPESVDRAILDMEQAVERKASLAPLNVEGSTRLAHL